MSGGTHAVLMPGREPANGMPRGADPFLAALMTGNLTESGRHSTGSSHCNAHYGGTLLPLMTCGRLPGDGTALARLCSRYHSPTSSARRPAYGAARSSASSGASGTSLGAISLFRSCRYLLRNVPQQ